MFTVAQIKQAHGKVRSGADFPAYIKEIKAMGVTFYQVYVKDGHTDFYGADDYHTTDAAKYEALAIARTADKVLFVAALKSHQQGNTSYMEFCMDCAKFGIVKWEVCMEKMTCTYFDEAGNSILVEQIPG